MAYRDRLLAFYRNQGLVGADDELVPRHQLLLVGGNPLPVRLAAAALEPRWLCLVASQGSAPTLPKLEQALRTVLPDCRLVVRTLRDAHSPAEMKTLIADLRRDEGLGPIAFGLHYSGGTKTMSQNAARFLGNTSLAVCTYIDAQRDELRCDALDAGLSIKDLEIALAEILDLHGLEIIRSPADLDALDQHPLRKELVAQIGAACFDGDGFDAYLRDLPPFLPREVAVPLGSLGLPPDALPAIAGTVALEGARANGEKHYRGSGAFAGWSLAALRRRCPAVPEGSTWKSLGKELGVKEPRKVVQLLCTDWFEEWLLRRLHGLAVFAELWHSTHLRGPATPQFELDILGRRGHEVLLVSCTTVAGKDAKGKAMEALLRAERLGGDMARVVLASFTRDDDTLTTLWRELSRLDPRSEDRFRVLGSAHYQGQAAVTHCQGTSPIRQTLDELFQKWF